MLHRDVVRKWVSGVSVTWRVITDDASALSKYVEAKKFVGTSVWELEGQRFSLLLLFHYPDGLTEPLCCLFSGQLIADHSQGNILALKKSIWTCIYIHMHLNIPYTHTHKQLSVCLSLMRLAPQTTKKSVYLMILWPRWVDLPSVYSSRTWVSNPPGATSASRLPSKGRNNFQTV